MNWFQHPNAVPVQPTTLFLALLLAYATGCISSGYYLVRWRQKKDIRQIGSGSTGATNVGRTLGPTGFWMTLLLDGAKGIAVALAAKWAQFDSWQCWAVITAVVTGHIWPGQLAFRGGKGVAPLVGAMLVADPIAMAVWAALSAAAWLVIGRFKMAGLCALALTPAALAVSDSSLGRAAGMVFPAALVLWAHRQNLRDGFKQRQNRAAERDA